MNINKALVVDDSKVAHLTLRKLLTERSIEVDWVGSGEDAIVYMEKQRPDIIFMDVMMPGMDGFETTSAITKNPAITAPPVIMCSANATEEDRQNATESGAASFLSKPYTPEQMDQVLNMVRGLPAPTVEPTVSPASEAPAAPAPEVPATPTIEAPAVPAPHEAPPASEPPPPAAPATPQPAFATADLERIAERAAWSMADKVARDVATEIATTKAEQAAQTVAEQTARTAAEEAGRKAAQAAVHAAQEAAKKVAGDIAQHTAMEVARANAEKAAQDMASEISEDIAKKNIARGLAVIRDDLAKSLEQQVTRSAQDSLAHIMAGQEFKQQLMQIMKDALLPTVESTSRQAADEAAQLALTDVAEARKRANLSLITGSVAILVAVGAIALSLFL